MKPQRSLKRWTWALLQDLAKAAHTASVIPAFAAADADRVLDTLVLPPVDTAPQPTAGTQVRASCVLQVRRSWAGALHSQDTWQAGECAGAGSGAGSAGGTGRASPDGPEEPEETEEP